MKTYFVYSDLHLFGPHEVRDVILDMISKDCIYLGDIIDLKNCKKEFIQAAKDAIISLERQLERRYVHGNHELTPFQDIYIADGVLFTHGDFQIWGQKRAQAFRSKKPGSGSVKRWLSKALNVGREALTTGELKEKHIKSLMSFAKSYNCHTIVIGHRHPKELIDNTYTNAKNGEKIRIIVVPRGISTIRV